MRNCFVSIVRLTPKLLSMHPTIIVVAYNRPHSLIRLLQALATATYPNANINLVISIDCGDNAEVCRIAQRFAWVYGDKIVLEHGEHLGLKKHILACGDLSEQYGAIIVLEDDLLVSKYYYSYVCQAINFYVNDKAIAGISLYHYAVSENGFFPFYPIDNGTDVYFMQIASSWGQAWTASQWQLFNTWFTHNDNLAQDEVVIPTYLQSWSASSWKKHFIHYLIATQRYFVFPRYALSTNFADAGTNASTKALYQVPIQQSAKKYCFEALATTYARYDAHFEIETIALQQLVPTLETYNFTTDIYGTKPLQKITTPYVLTTRHSHTYIKSYGLKMLPNIANVLYNVAGNDIVLAATTAVNPSPTPLYKHYYPIQSIASSVFESLQAQATVSIISCINTLNATTQRSLTSVLTQNYPNIEHIIIDTSACTLKDKTLKNRSNVRIIYPKSDLLSDAFTEALNTCKGQIVGILPSSSYYTVNAIVTAVKIFSSFKKISCFTSAAHAQHLHYPQQMRYTQGSTAPAPPIETLFWRNYLSKNLSIQTAKDKVKVMNNISQKISTQTNIYTLVEQLVHTPILPIAYKLASNWFKSCQPNRHTNYKWLKAFISWCSYPFYHYNIPIAQYPYIDINAYLPLIKYNKHKDCFYLSAY